jgi:hypothetical protein
MEVAKAFEDRSIGKYKDDTIIVTIIDNDYPGSDFHINVQPQNVMSHSPYNEHLVYSRS